MRQLFSPFYHTIPCVSSGMQSAEQADSIAEVVEVLVADSVADSSVVPISDAVAGPDSPLCKSAEYQTGCGLLPVPVASDNRSRGDDSRRQRGCELFYRIQGGNQGRFCEVAR